jgi:hypothetical protein
MRDRNELVAHSVLDHVIAQLATLPGANMPHDAGF